MFQGNSLSDLSFVELDWQLIQPYLDLVNLGRAYFLIPHPVQIKGEEVYCYLFLQWAKTQLVYQQNRQYCFS